MREYRFDDRVAVVTGAGRGLGRAYALLLAARGASVVVNDPGFSQRGENADSAPAADTVAAIMSAGGNAVVCTESVATESGGQAIVETALESYGRLDIVIHNAGNVRYGNLRELTHDDFDAVLDVHLRGAFNVVRPAFPVMADANYGRVVLTSSIGGLYGNIGVANYAAAKAGIIGFSNVIAIEGAEQGVRSNVIVPAAVTRLSEGRDTSSFPDMDPELIAPTVGWLAHETCSVSGDILVAVAGRVARAYVAETRGIHRPKWSIEEVASEIDAIRDTREPWLLDPVRDGHNEHLRKSFALATEAIHHVG
ncbi:SDR family NAD(P)-dependent oxidoreductase [Gordonia sp. NPDC127522]|uniref:SDR family NAD(P)-dependent oxidoreductase n=1 Tax=Gordonia sp. NPDC127522 TaxID=3345390 RepID=UPI00363A1CA9